MLMQRLFYFWQNNHSNMKTVLFSLTTIAILSILSSLNSCSGIEGDDPPETMQDTTPQNLPEEYVQWDSTRVDNSKSFQRAFVVLDGRSRVLTWDQDQVEADWQVVPNVAEGFAHQAFETPSADGVAVFL